MSHSFSTLPRDKQDKRMIILPTSGTVRVWAVPLVISLLVLSHPAKGQNKQQEQSSREQLGASGTATNSLQQLLKRFPKADKNQDGRLTWAELNQYRKTARQTNPRGVGVPTTFEVHPGWKQSTFPETSMSVRAPSVIREVWAKVSKGQQVPTYDPPRRWWNSRHRNWSQLHGTGLQNATHYQFRCWHGATALHSPGRWNDGQCSIQMGTGERYFPVRRKTFSKNPRRHHRRQVGCDGVRTLL